MRHEPRLTPEPVDRPSRRHRRALALERIAASRNTRVGGRSGSSRLIVTGAVVALGATSFVGANSTSIDIAPTLCSSSTATIRGSARNDVLVGTRHNDIIWGGGGHDVIYGMQGNDQLCGGDGNDRIYGSSGDDYLDGGPGTDVLRGDSGKRDSCLNGEQVARCESVGTTSSPPTTVPATTAPATTSPATTSPATTAPAATSPTSTAPPTTPPTGGRFTTLPVGSALPTEQQCATLVRRMSENRPENATYNATKGTSPNDEFPRVTGNFTGTTDEILQWAACKWGIDEDLVRAQIALESWWTMTNVGDNGESFGLGQVRVPYHGSAFEDDNAKRSSAYNVDYTYQIWRDCFEGRLTWLNTVERGAEYRSGDAMGCTGVWFSGRWRTPAAVQYIARVDEYLRKKIWTQSDFGPSTPTPVGQTAPTTTTTTTTTTTVAPTSTTAPPTTQATTTTVAGPATTQPPPTAAPTTQAPATTVAPSGTPSAGAFVEIFDAASDLDQWEVEVHHRTDHDGGQPSGTWQADHGLTCGEPTATKRNLNATDRADAVYWCPNGGGHVMTSMGEVDGYSTVSMSPKNVFATVRKVCWEQNVSASLGKRQWVEVLIVPAAVIDTPHPSGHRITFNNPFLFEIDGTVRPHVPGMMDVGVAPISGDSAMFMGGEVVARWPDSPNDPEGRASVAIRRTHCLTELSGNRVEFRVDTQTTPYVRIVDNVSLPDNSRVILSTHHYTPTKDQGFDVTTTWHWDNLTVE